MNGGLAMCQRCSSLLLSRSKYYAKKYSYCCNLGALQDNNEVFFSLLSILSFCDELCSMLSFVSTCKSFCTISRDDLFWKRLYATWCGNLCPDILVEELDVFAIMPEVLCPETWRELTILTETKIKWIRNQRKICSLFLSSDFQSVRFSFSVVYVAVVTNQSFTVLNFAVIDSILPSLSSPGVLITDCIVGEYYKSSSFSLIRMSSLTDQELLGCHLLSTFSTFGLQLEGCLDLKPLRSSAEMPFDVYVLTLIGC